MHVVQKGWRPADDASEVPPREQRALKSVTFQESVSVINDVTADMELESQQVVQVSLTGSNLRCAFQDLWVDTGTAQCGWSNCCEATSRSPDACCLFSVFD